ncbi:hypothetical protein [Frankia nepalensis]|uniref:Uncharacterized protein n=1 Tax=Frankia nepalensis TaxID=1836974 RepID=A0A937RKL8_9ACTN|nr:hypothetical protein [Frankia nepalensis]MBL7496036.1 hypothetical protein [Frankia nepalensis]MBL7511843.1 hypothetical protein [Frankia nepalensis]MBL7630640.1 hypothetical protein [Frankia nepalensis]
MTLPTSAGVPCARGAEPGAPVRSGSSTMPRRVARRGLSDLIRPASTVWPISTVWPTRAVAAVAGVAVAP